jgi:release factor glutamine methyltransferase
LEIKVTPDVLIPRPETEGLAERGWKFLNQIAAASEPVSALDFGTGSGCVAIALAKHAPGARICAVDASSAALKVARDNANLHAVTDQIRFVAGDGFEPLAPDERFDLIISNPPYIPSAEVATLAPEVRDHDPRLALDGGPDGLVVLRRLATAGALGHLKPGGALMTEFGDGQAEAVRELFDASGWAVHSIESDLSGRPRILIARGRKF